MNVNTSFHLLKHFLKPSSTVHGRWILTRVRIHQLKRQLEELGIGYALILLAFFCVTIFYVYLAYLQKQKSLFVVIFIVFAILMIHLSRSDKQFIYRQVNFSVRNIFTEYFIFTLPVTIPSLFTSHLFYFPIFVIAFYIIANTKSSFKQRTVLPHISKIISPSNFEWISGFRKNYISILIALLLALITCWIRIAPLIFLWFIMASVISFYQECESLQILFTSSDSPKEMLRKKIINHSQFLLIIFIPVLLVNCIFNHGMILINIAFLLIQITTLIFAILLKYTTYTPNENLKSNTILLTIVSLSTFIPFLLPVPIIMCFRNYSKSVKNLNFYFND